jgi:hypothetical protein
LEAASGIEPLKRVLQTLALTTWLRRHKRHGLEGQEAGELTAVVLGAANKKLIAKSKKAINLECLKRQARSNRE